MNEHDLSSLPMDPTLNDLSDGLQHGLTLISEADAHVASSAVNGSPLTATVAARNGNMINKNIADIEREVFVGDLSFFCREYHLYQLFSKFGRVAGARIRRSESNHQSLMYGFVKMTNAEQARVAASALEDKLFMGRTMRLVRCFVLQCLSILSVVSASSHRVQLCNLNGHPSAYTPKFGYQLHVSFISHVEINNYVTEEFLRRIFEPFGEVVDALLTRHSVARDPMKQSGYGFVYMATEQGAMAAISSMQRVEIDGFKFDCSISHRSVVGGKKGDTPRHNAGGYFQFPPLQAIQIPMPAIFMNHGSVAQPTGHESPHGPQAPSVPQQQSSMMGLVPPVPPIDLSQQNAQMYAISRRQFARLVSDEEYYYPSSGSNTPVQSPRHLYINTALDGGAMSFGSPSQSPRMGNSPRVYPPQPYMYGTPPQSPRYGSPMIPFVNPVWMDQQFLARHVTVPMMQNDMSGTGLAPQMQGMQPVPGMISRVMSPSEMAMYGAPPMMNVNPYNNMVGPPPNAYMRTNSHELMDPYMQNGPGRRR
jgi:RNA recognition motif-containing protein